MKKKLFVSEMSSDGGISQNVNIDKTIHSDETTKNEKNKLKNKNKNLSHQIENTPIPSGNNLDDGNLFEKYSIIYVKNFMFNKNDLKYKENIKFNFFENIELFTRLNYTNFQYKLFQDIIGFNSQKINYSCGELDLILNNIEGKFLNDKMTEFKFSFYKCNRLNIDNNKKYNILFEITKDIFKQCKEKEKQLIKYKKILALLNSTPNPLELRKKLNFEEENKIALVLLTNGNYSDFDFYTKILGYNKNYQEDSNDESFQFYEQKIDVIKKTFNLFKKVNFPVFVLYIPKIIENQEFKPKYVRDLEKKLNENQKQLNETQKQLNETQKQLSELKAKFENYLNSKNENINNNKHNNNNI